MRALHIHIYLDKSLWNWFISNGLHNLTKPLSKWHHSSFLGFLGIEERNSVSRFVTGDLRISLDDSFSFSIRPNWLAGRTPGNKKRPRPGLNIEINLFYKTRVRSLPFQSVTHSLLFEDLIDVTLAEEDALSEVVYIGANIENDIEDSVGNSWQQQFHSLATDWHFLATDWSEPGNN